MMNTSITLPHRYLLKDAGKYRESNCPMEFCIRFTTRMQLGCSMSQWGDKLYGSLVHRIQRSSMSRPAAWSILLVLAAAIPCPAYAQKDTVVVRPVEIEDVLVNPG